MLFNISKQAINPGKNFGPYGIPKSATLSLMRQYAIDYASIKVRSNAINADRIRSGLLTNNMITGLTTGFQKQLIFNGVGYRAAVKGNVLELQLGFSHPINHEIPAGINITVEKNTITIKGSDKQLVGQVAAEIRGYRPPEPYKGKGIKYSDEHIIRKAGKTAKK